VFVIDFSADDDRSGIRQCSMALGTYPGGNDVSGTLVQMASRSDDGTVPRKHSGAYALNVLGAPTQNFTSTVKPVLGGYSFYAWAVCQNDAGLANIRYAAQHFVADFTPPMAGMVFDGYPATADVDYSANQELFPIHWRWFVDTETAIHGFVVALGTAPGQDDLLPAQEVMIEKLGSGILKKPPVLRMTLSLVGAEPASPGTTVFASVKAIDAAGHESDYASSNGVTIDKTPATFSAAAIEHALAGDTPMYYTGDATQVTLRWSGIVDGESRVIGYDYGLSSGSMKDVDVVPFAWVGLSTQAVLSGLTLEHNQVYFGAVRATNAVGMRSYGISHGILVDLTTPNCTLLDHEGPQHMPSSLSHPNTDPDTLHRDRARSTSGLYAGSLLCFDAESGIAAVQWFLGTSPGRQDVSTIMMAGIEDGPGMLRLCAKRLHATLLSWRNPGSSMSMSPWQAQPPFLMVSPFLRRHMSPMGRVGPFGCIVAVSFTIKAPR
jgi:hypothetical protein